MNTVEHAATMRGPKRLSLLLGALLAVVFLLSAAPSSASAVLLGINEANGASEQDMEAIKRSGADLYQLGIVWKAVADQGNWKESPAWQQSYDKQVEAAAKNDVSIVGGLYGRKTPAALHQYYLSSEWGEWLEFAWTAVQRYGRNGAFWTSHPGLPYRPITSWTVWNEPNLSPNNPGENVLPQKYAEFLIATASTIRSAQNTIRKAGEPVDTKVIHAGLWQPDGLDVGTFVEKASAVAGYASSFDEFNLHPYSFNGSQAEKIAGLKANLEAGRNALDKWVGTSKSIWLGELGWPLTGTGHPSVSESEQAELLTSAFDWVKANAGKYKVDLLTWYLYKDFGGVTWDGYCGLRDSSGVFRKSWFAFQKEASSPAWPMPAVQTNAATTIAWNRATLNGTIDARNVPTKYRFEYGLTTSYGNSVPIPDGNAGSAVGAIAQSVTIQSLQPETTYHYRLVASSEAGTVYGGDASFTTPMPPPTPATVIDGSGRTHIYYRGFNQQLQEWYQSGALWKHKVWGAGGVVGGTPAAILGSDGKIWVYFKGTNGQLKSWWFKGTEWGAEEWGFANAMAGDPTAIQASDGKRWVYYKSPEGQLKSWWFKGAESGAQNWGFANAMGGDPTAVEDSEGKRWVYFKASNGQLRDWWFKGASFGTEEWGFADAMGGDPSVIQAAEGKRWVYFKASNGQLRDWWFKGAGYGTEEWGFANAMGGDPTAVEDSEGKRWVYFRSPNSQLKDWWFKGASYGMEEWGYQDQVEGNPAGVATGSGKRDVFYFDPTGVPYRWSFDGAEFSREEISTPPVKFVPNPVAVLDSSGATHVYYRGYNEQLQEWYQSGASWKHREWGFAGAMGGNPSALLSADGRIWVYYRSPEGQLKSWWFKGAESGAQNWGFANAMGGDPTAVEDSEGKRWVYFKASNGQLRDWWFKGAGYGTEEWGFANAMAGDPTAIQASDGKRWVYYKSPEGQLKSWWFKGAESGAQNWGFANAMGGDPTAVEDSEGKRWVYFKASNGQLRDWWFKGASFGTEEWGFANAVGGDPTAVEDSEGKRWVYFKASDGQLRNWWFKGAEWGAQNWGNAGSLGADPAAIATGVGKREVFYFDPGSWPFRWSFNSAGWGFEALE